MVGLPGQTLRDLAGDVIFFRDLGADMIGMVRMGLGGVRGRGGRRHSTAIQGVPLSHTTTKRPPSTATPHHARAHNPHTHARRAPTSQSPAPPWPPCGSSSMGGWTRHRCGRAHLGVRACGRARPDGLLPPPPTPLAGMLFNPAPRRKQAAPAPCCST